MKKMNGRYSIVVVLLLGAFVFGLSSLVGDMFSDDVCAGTNTVAYSPSSRRGNASGGTGSSVVGNAPVLPMRSSKHSLFHHTAVAVPAYRPASHTSASGATPYYIYSPSMGSTATASAGASAVSSADGFSLGGATEAHGVYLTSGATVQSYGGAMSEYASSSASGSTASAYSVATGMVSSAAFAASSSEASSGVSGYSFSLNTRAAATPALMQSADQTLAARTGAPSRTGVRKINGLNGGGDEWINWFDWYVQQGDATGGWTETNGTYYFTEEQLRAAYDYWKDTQSSSMPLIHTYEDWLAWITGSSNTSRYQLKPIGDGVWVLVLLAAVYALWQIRKTYQYKLRNNTQTL